MAKRKSDIRILLDNIRSVHNAGSIFRTAETIGVSVIYCIGTTPVPLDRFDRPRKDFAKVSLGAENSVLWEYSRSAGTLMRQLKKDGFEIVALEQSPRAIDYKSFKPKNKSLIILGNEVEGVSKTLLKLADVIAEIPLRGNKESLNVSVSAGIALFRWFDI